MISFIIIGRNEGWKLTQCLESVFNTIKQNQLTSFEVIYVDSKSLDDSIDRALMFKNVKAIKLIENFNAAIARNVGANQSIGNVLFFIDGDMEIQAEFLPLVYKEKNGLISFFVSGQFVNYYYDNKGNLILKKPFHRIGTKPIKQYTTGGLFLIRREIWNEIGGMCNYLRNNEDIDLGLRLAKKGYFLLRYPEVLAIHHTISYEDKNRLFKEIYKGDILYRSVLLHKHLLNKYYWLLLVRGSYTSIFLLFSYILCLALSSFLPLIGYLIVVLCRVAMRNQISSAKFYKFLYFILSDNIFWVLPLFFWPSIKKQKIAWEIKER